MKVKKLKLKSHQTEPNMRLTGDGLSIFPFLLGIGAKITLEQNGIETLIFFFLFLS
jgi:hypothetical protein